MSSDMALQGNLRDFSATEILQLLGTQKKTGCLLLEWNTENAVIYVQEGRIISTRKPNLAKDDPLLLFLLKVHRLSDEQYRGILTIQEESQRDVEDLLVNGRYLEAEELGVYIEREMFDDLMRVTRWEDGTYRFDPNNRWPSEPLVRMNIEGALIEAARRADEQKRFVTVFKDPYQLIGVLDLPDPNEPLTEEERELFGLIDGQHTVSEIVEAAPLSEYETYEALHRMLEARWLEFVGRRNPGLPQLAVVPDAAPTPQKGPSILREVAVTAVVVVAFAIARLAAQAVHPTVAQAAGRDPFTAAEVRDLRYALDLFRREHGSYPDRLEELVDDRWIAAEQLHVSGYAIHYRRQREGSDYRLELKVDR
jgi:hypothetical protein